MDANKELRKVPTAFLDHIADILDDGIAWKIVMNLIPKDLESDHFEKKYNSDHVRMIEKYARERNLKCSLVLLDEWGTSGRKRPTLRTLMNVLVKAQMFRAADHLAKQLNENPPPRPLSGPAASTWTDCQSNLVSESSEQSRELNNNCNEIDRTNETPRNIPTRKAGSETSPKNEQSRPSTSAAGNNLSINDLPNSKDITPNLEHIHVHNTNMIPNNSKLLPGKDGDNNCVTTKQAESETFVGNLECPEEESALPSSSATCNGNRIPNSEHHMPNLDNIPGHYTTMIPNNNSAPVTSSEYMPRFSKLLPGKDGDNNSVTTKQAEYETSVGNLECPKEEPALPSSSATCNGNGIPNSEHHMPNLDNIPAHYTTMIPNNNSAPVTSSEYMPRFSKLLPGADGDNNSVPTKHGGSVTSVDNLKCPKEEPALPSSSATCDSTGIQNSEHNMPNLDNIPAHYTTMIPNNNSAPVTSSEYMPRFSKLLSGKDGDNNSVPTKQTRSATSSDRL